MALYQDLLSLLILLVIGLIVYTSVRKQSIKETFTEIKELIGGFNG